MCHHISGRCLLRLNNALLLTIRQHDTARECARIIVLETKSNFAIYKIIFTTWWQRNPWKKSVVIIITVDCFMFFIRAYEATSYVGNRQIAVGQLGRSYVGPTCVAHRNSPTQNIRWLAILAVRSFGQSNPSCDL